jgi:hypothetical protein
MSAKVKVAKGRKPSFPDDDVIEIFRRLENMSPRQHKSDAFRDEDVRLHRLLGLYSEWRCSSCSVFDREASPPWPEDMPAAKDWHKVRAVRLELLAAIQEEASCTSPDRSVLATSN